MTNEELKNEIRGYYGKIARESDSCCVSACGCGEPETTTAEAEGSYERDADIVDSADLGLGCGDPVRFAGLKPGMKVLDLGSGAGIDVFLSARQVEPGGEAIGLDMTGEMLDRARANAAKLRIPNARFVKGEIENIPLAQNWVDRVISNCVINLVPDKKKAFSEIYRVLKPGGTFIISDIVVEGEIPEELKKDPRFWAGCISGAEQKSTYMDMISRAGFHDVKILSERGPDVPSDLTFRVLSITVTGTK
jgi:SAM-dependent methyltransferase